MQLRATARIVPSVEEGTWIRGLEGSGFEGSKGSLEEEESRGDGDPRFEGM